MFYPLTRLELSASTAEEKHAWCAALESALRTHIVATHTTTLKLARPPGPPPQADDGFEREASAAYTASYVKMKDAQFDYG